MRRRADSPHYPVFLDLTGRLAVVVGGDATAERKARTLAKHGADVVVIAPQTTEKMRELEADGLLTIETREYERGDLAGAFVVVCVSDSEDVRRAVHDEAASVGCLASVAGAPELCDFIAPSVVRRGRLQIAISTGGLAPVVAKRLRRRLRDEFGEEWATYVKLMGEVRALATRRVPGGEEARAPIYEAIADSGLLERIRDGAAPTAEQVFAEFAGKAGTGAGSEGAADPAAEGGDG